MNESLSQATTPEAGTIVVAPGRPLAPMLNWARTRRARLICAALLGVMSVQMLVAASHKSISTDEVVHIPAGYYHLVLGDFQFLNQHPPVSMMIGALPLLFMQPGLMSEAELQKIPRDDSFVFVLSQRFWTPNESFYHRVAFWTRVPMIAFTALFGIVIFLFARRLFGERAALIAVALFTLEPTVLAHGPLVHTDMTSAFGLLLLAYAVYVYVSSPSLRRAAYLGAAMGLAPLMKFSMVAVAPLAVVGIAALLVFPARLKLPRRAALAHAGAIILISLLVINAGYFFDHRSFTEADNQWIVASFPSRAGLLLFGAHRLRYLVPTDFLLGTYWQIWHSTVGHAGSIFGQQGRFGWWYYFPVAFALKTTIPFLLTSVAAICWGLWRIVKRRDWTPIFVLAPFFLFTALVMASTINIGVRFYLPAYPFLFIMSGALLDRLIRIRWPRALTNDASYGALPNRRATAPLPQWSLGTILVAIVLGWCVIEVIRTYPNYIPYMNELAYSRPHWWYLSDSNVEWGDSMPELASYLHARGETKVRAAMLGAWPLGRYGIDFVDALEPAGASQPETKYTVIGASFLNGSTVPPGPPGSGRETEEQRVNYFEEYRYRSPEAVIGNSIYVFRMR
jgi:4-amino-4-deoxy-L-arabinose transferase-like glycosyltransferase